LAPVLPFATETMYANLVRTVDPAALPSVHLCEWPEAEMGRVDEQVLAEMALAMDLASCGHAARAAASLKVRQPVARMRAFLAPDRARQLPEELLAVVRDELNAKALEFAA